MNVAINGFGRIGRLVFRAAIERGEDINFVGINDLTDAETLAHLLKYDSVHGKFKGEVRAEGNNLVVNGKTIQISASKTIEDIPFKDIDVMIESTGIYTSRKDLERHIANGAKRAVLSAPAKDKLDATIVLGVNDEDLNDDAKVLSNARQPVDCPVCYRLQERHCIFLEHYLNFLQFLQHFQIIH